MAIFEQSNQSLIIFYSISRIILFLVKNRFIPGFVIEEFFEVRFGLLLKNKYTSLPFSNPLFVTWEQKSFYL